MADDSQNRGIGTRLLSQTMEWAWKHCLPAVYLMVVQDNQKVIHLYQRFGFTIYDEEFDAADELSYFRMVAHLQSSRSDLP